jgi:glycosyltransferase involved in cell wall biosynthesis
VSPQKRLDRAIEIALRSGHQLKVAAKIYDEDRAYHEAVIKPMLRNAGSQVEFLGEIGGHDKDELIGKASAPLFPIDWPEPFGLVMIEALACGTPVIAWPHGSVPEVIKEGHTGYLVNTISEAAAAVEKLSQLSRAACRQSFEQRFDAAHRKSRDDDGGFQRPSLARARNVRSYAPPPPANGSMFTARASG